MNSTNLSVTQHKGNPSTPNTHIVSIAFNFDDAAITRQIEETVVNAVITKITDEIKEIIYAKKSGYGYYSNKVNENDNSPLKNIVHVEVRSIIEENKDAIIKIAASELASSLRRSKAVKEATEEVVKKYKECA